MRPKQGVWSAPANLGDCHSSAALSSGRRLGTVAIHISLSRVVDCGFTRPELSDLLVALSYKNLKFKLPRRGDLHWKCVAPISRRDQLV